MYSKSNVQQAICCALVTPLSVMALPEFDEDDRKQVNAQFVVTATKTKRLADGLPVSVSQIEQDSMSEYGAKDIKDALASEVDLSVKATARRYAMSGASTGRAGNEGVTIRGIEGNRVLMIQDGIRLPQAFAFGPFSVGRGDYLTIDSLASIEVLRGPASTLYGSDGLAGIVSMRTLEYEDIHKRSVYPNQQTHASLSSAYSSSDQSSSLSAITSGKTENSKWLVLAASRYGHELANQGNNDSVGLLRTTPNPMDARTQYVLGKYETFISPTHSISLHAEHQEGRQSIDVLSAQASYQQIRRGGSSLIEVNRLTSNDSLDRNRISLKHHYENWDAPFIQKLDTHLYWQAASNNQVSNEERLVNGQSDPRIRDNRYQESMVGISTHAQSYFEGLGEHRITYGFDLSQSVISGIRDGINPSGAEVFPNKPFPETNYRLIGAYIQDEIEFRRVSVIPGVRIDQYQMTPEIGASNRYVVNEGGAITPRLGLIWHADRAIAPYVQYATGFRAPSPDQVNSNFENRLHGYISAPNPNLEPEKARSIEIGLKGHLGSFSYATSYFDNHYEDFISQEKVSGQGTAIDPSIYQYVNLSNARIRGWDFRGLWQVNSRWQFHAAIAQAQGESQHDGFISPLNSVDPMRVIAGFNYQTKEVKLFGRWRYNFEKNSSDVSAIRIAENRMAEQFIPPASGIVDLGMAVSLGSNVMIRTSINNIFNTRYWNWSDVRGIAVDSPVIDAYTGPGRSMQVSLRVDY